MTEVSRRCRHCGALIMRRAGERPGVFDQRRFCSRVCSVQFFADLHGHSGQISEWPEVFYTDAEVPREGVSRHNRPSIFAIVRAASSPAMAE